MEFDFRGKIHEAYVTNFDYAKPNRVEITLDGKVYIVTNRVGVPDKGVTKEELKDFALGILFKISPVVVDNVEFEIPGDASAKTEIAVVPQSSDGTALPEDTTIIGKSFRYGEIPTITKGKVVKK